MSFAGVTDLLAMLNDDAERSGPQSARADYQRATIGDRRRDRERLRNVSPVNLAPHVRASILLLHGTDDAVVPIEHSRRMHRALETAGRDVRLVELRGDDHWQSDPETRVQAFQEIGVFLARHLGPPPASN